MSDGSCAKADFPLRPTTRLKGKVLVPQGRTVRFPRRSSRLLACKQLLPFRSGFRTTNERSGFRGNRADADGDFEIWPIAPGDYYVGINITTSPTPADTLRSDLLSRRDRQNESPSRSYRRGGDEVRRNAVNLILAQKRTIHIEAVGTGWKAFAEGTRTAGGPATSRRFSKQRGGR